MIKKSAFLILAIAIILLLIAGTGCVNTSNESVENSNMISPDQTQNNSDTNLTIFAKNKDTVYVYYKGTLDDGSIFDEKIKGTDEPLEFILGNKRMVTGFENAVLDMKEGETKTVSLTPDEAYGESIDYLKFSVNRSIFSEESMIFPGNTILLTGIDGSQIQATIINSTDSEVLLDANHHLAGKNLTFEITLDKIDHPE